MYMRGREKASRRSSTPSHSLVHFSNAHTKPELPVQVGTEMGLEPWHLDMRCQYPKWLLKHYAKHLLVFTC